MGMCVLCGGLGMGLLVWFGLLGWVLVVWLTKQTREPRHKTTPTHTRPNPTNPPNRENQIPETKTPTDPETHTTPRHPPNRQQDQPVGVSWSWSARLWLTTFSGDKKSV
eukprot:3205806-Amphidinium_carterae.1